MKPAQIAHVSECIRTLRSVRRFHQAQVAPDLVDFVISHAIQAGSGKNRQPWRFIVIRDFGRRAKVADWYRAAWEHLLMARSGTGAADDKQITAASTLAEHLDEAPVLIVACFQPSPANPADFFGGASIYPAIQNLLLAARAVGLGATLTTIQAFEDPEHAPSRTGSGPVPASSPCAELKHLLAIPEPVVPAAVIPLGYPRDPFTPTSQRSPVHAVTYAEEWGRPWRERSPDADASPLAVTQPFDL